jgi:hypothetical protein
MSKASRTDDLAFLSIYLTYQNLHIQYHLNTNEAFYYLYGTIGAPWYPILDRWDRQYSFNDEDIAFLGKRGFAFETRGRFRV